MIDLIKYHYPEEPRINCLDHGFVRLVDLLPRVVDEGQTPTADYAIAEAARVSYGRRSSGKSSDDRKLIRYLYRHRHTSPFEMIEFKFHCSMPIFVARQWIRHRTASVNEISGRYSVLPSKFYVPSKDDVRKQSTTNKQMTEGTVSPEEATRFLETLKYESGEAYKAYERAYANGIGREQARICLPLSLYTEWYWKIDLHNLLHFLTLRTEKHAQAEIQVFANAMLKLIEPLVPVTIEAWRDYAVESVTLTKLEVSKLKELLANVNDSGVSLNSGNDREDAEWLEKLTKLRS